MAQVPAALGYRMPAEWEPHEATWIAWPHEREDWPGKFEAIPWVYTEIVRHLHYSESVRILVNDGRARRRARQMLDQLNLDWNHIELRIIATDRVWTRDYGPLFVTSPALTLGATNWRFNAWAKYHNWQRDDAATEQIIASVEAAGWQPELNGSRVVLEG